ncbi:MAG TPA: histidine phosphatase family protein [Burkholderiales bacterium]
MPARLVALLLSLAGCAAWGDVGLSELRQGGYVLYMRHASTDFSQSDARMSGYDDCANQRNLTDKGRAEARSIARHIRRLGIPIGEVLASPFCRTMKSARLAFGAARPTLEARGGPMHDAERYAALKKLMSAPVGKGANRAIVGHGNPFYALAGPPYLAEGEIAVLAPKGSGFEVLRRIRVEDWQALE